MKQFFFLSGLPRSGSTVLTSIFSQNPDVYASPNSALLELLVNVRNHLRTAEQTRAFMQPTQEHDVLIGIMEGMYAFTDKYNIIDKSRAWPHPENVQLLIELLPKKPKFIAMVRDLPSVLASFITLIEHNPTSTSFVDRELKKQGKSCSTENRCDFLFSSGGNIHESWYSLKMAFDAGYRDLFHVIEYDDLMSQPEEVLNDIYTFLELPTYTHDLTNIINETPEDDTVYNLPGMHEIRPQLQKISKDPADVLGASLAEKYAAVPHFWRQQEQIVKPKAKNPFNLV